jgi:hypothetical protein
MLSANVRDSSAPYLQDFAAAILRASAPDLYMKARRMSA